MIEEITFNKMQFTNFDIEQFNSILKIHGFYVDHDYSSVTTKLRLEDNRTISIIDELLNKSIIDKAERLEDLITEYLKLNGYKVDNETIVKILGTLDKLLKEQTKDLYKFFKTFEKEWLPKVYLEVDSESIAKAIENYTYDKSYLIYDRGIKEELWGEVTRNVYLALYTNGALTNIVKVNTLKNKTLKMEISYSKLLVDKAGCIKGIQAEHCLKLAGLYEICSEQRKAEIIEGMTLLEKMEDKKK